MILYMCIIIHINIREDNATWKQINILKSKYAEIFNDIDKHK